MFIHENVKQAQLYGELICSDTFLSLGSSCVLKCPPGYAVVGNSETKCWSMGDWSPKIGHCKSLI